MTPVPWSRLFVLACRVVELTADLAALLLNALAELVNAVRK